MKKSFIEQLRSEDWVIVFAGMFILLATIFFPSYMPIMPKTLVDASAWMTAGYMFIFLIFILIASTLAQGKKIKGLFGSFVAIYAIAVAANLTAEIPFIKSIGLESVFFSVAYGLIISNIFATPKWLSEAVQSEFYIKIGLVVLGSTIIFSEIMKAGALGMIQALVVVLTVWYFSYWIARKVFKVDDQMATMLSSAVSICGVSAAIATCGAIKGDNKKLSYVISLVLVVAIPMMYLMPWLANKMGLSQEVAGAWLGGTIDTTGAVVAAGKFIGETAETYSVIIKSSQNVLLGLAAFIISLYWSYKGNKHEEKPTIGVLWDRFPKFVIGFALASLVFSICIGADEAKALGKITKGFSNSLFSVAFVCIGLETRFKDLFTQENRRPLKAFLTAQTFNVIVTLIVAYLLFEIIMPLT